jgi:hypothetical protein
MKRLLSTLRMQTRVLRALTAVAPLLLTACVTTTVMPVAPLVALHVDDEARALVRDGPLGRGVQDLPALVRIGVAQLALRTPFDAARRQRLPAAVDLVWTEDHLVDTVTSRLSLDDDTRHATLAFLHAPATRAVLESALAVNDAAPDAFRAWIARKAPISPDVESLARCLFPREDAHQLTAAPARAAARIVAAAQDDRDRARKDEADSLRNHDGAPFDVRVFAFAWRDIDDDALTETAATCASPAVRAYLAALGSALSGAVERLTDETVARVRAEPEP